MFPGHYFFPKINTPSRKALGADCSADACQKLSMALPTRLLFQMNSVRMHDEVYSWEKLVTNWAIPPIVSEAQNTNVKF